MRKLYVFALSCMLGVAGLSAQPYQSVEPKDGSIVASLSEVTIDFAGDLVDFGVNYQNVTVTGNEYNAKCTLEFGEKDNQIVVTMAEITTKGDYTINFPEGAVTLDMVTVPAFALNYTVGENLAADVTVIPAAGDVKWLYEVVYYNSAIEKPLNTNSNFPATVTTPSGETLNMTSVYDWQIGNGKYRFYLPKLATEKGEYTVNFPEGAIYYNNDNWERVELPACSFKYNVVGGELTQIEGTPSIEDPTTLFNQFSIAFPGYETVEKGNPATVNIWFEGREYAVTSFSTDYNITVEGNTINYLNQYSSFTDPGVYYMTFPEGSVLLGEEKTPCTPFVYEFKVVEPEPVNMVFTPEDGASVGMLYHVIVNFPDLDKVTLNSNASASLIGVREDGTAFNVGGAYGSRGFVEINANTYDIVFSNMATVSGEYIVELQKNSFSFEGGFNQHAAITLNFTAPETVEPSIDPADGSSVDKLQNFTISFPNESVVKVNPYLTNNNVILYQGTELVDNGWGGFANQQIGSATVYTPVEGSTNSFTFSLSAAAINKDDYLLVISVGLFLIGEDNQTYSSAAQFHFSCTGEGLDKISVNPSEPVSELSEIEITYVNETAIYLQSDWVGFSIYKEVEGQAWGTFLEYPSAANGGVTVEGNVLKIKLQNTYTEEGVYYTEITAYSLFMSDGTTPSTPQRVTFTVSETTGIENVATEAISTDNRIFTIQGIEVKDMSKPGLYIVGGKKVLVR